MDYQKVQIAKFPEKMLKDTPE